VCFFPAICRYEYLHDLAAGLVYSVIAPLILVFSIIFFGALWVLYRSYPPRLSNLDLGTSDLFYPTAMRQLFTGIYFMELCLAGLFFLVRDAQGKAAYTPQAVIMMLLTGLTALFHYALDQGYEFRWLSMPVISKQRPDQITEPEWMGRREVLSTAKPKLFQAEDDALDSTRPILWIPKDELGISDDEIYHIRRTYNSI
jgi:hypothetical protein